MTPETLGQRIKYLRTRRGLSQAQLSDKMDVSAQTISNWESDYKSPRMGMVQKIADFFNRPVGYLIDGETPQIVAEDTHSYTYLPASIAAGALSSVDPFTFDDVQTIDLSDHVMGRYAGDQNLIVLNVNGESMNRVIPDGSLIAVKKIDSITDLRDGDIVVFSEDEADYSVKRFFDDRRSKTYSFSPDSSDMDFRPIVYRYEDAASIEIVGRVVVYSVVL